MKKMLLIACLIMSTNLFANQDEPRLQTLMATMGQKAQMMMMGIAYENFDMIIEACQWVNNHPEPTADLQKIKDELGYQAVAFKLMDKMAHNAANDMLQAAQEKNIGKVAKAYGKMVKSCTRCHKAFRDRLRTVLHTDKYNW